MVPTIRQDCILEFLSVWKNLDWIILMVEDNPTRTIKITQSMPYFGHYNEFIGPNSVIHYSWKEIDEELGEKSWIISRHDTAIKSFGFWRAYMMGADYIFVLDDDCLPIAGVDHIAEHLNKLENTTRWTESVPGQRTRGLPYQNRGGCANVALSMGLWEGIPDFDSVYTLGANPPSEIQLPKHNFLVAQGQYCPLCGMNLCFKREIAPLMYFPLMGDGQPFRRFDDIWCGIIAKKVMDHLGLLVSVGKPMIHHKKASNVFTNLVAEASGIAANEHFWETIDAISLTKHTVLSCMIEVGEGLEASMDSYLKKLGQAILIWSSLYSLAL